MKHEASLGRLLMLGIGGALTALSGIVAAQTVLEHVHGLAFTSDGKGLMAPAHIGLSVYRDGRWNKVRGSAHDFMGLSIANKAMYTSGHPAPGAFLLRPLGLIKSTDGGATWRQLALAGESDFHLIAAGYRSNVVYVVNTAANSRMPQPGVYLTQDDGKSWKPTNTAALSRLTTAVAAHPVHAGTVAIGTLDGLYVSRDFGAVFQRVGPTAAVSAVAFDADGKHLYVARGEASVLERVGIDVSGTNSIALPALAGDFVTYIAQNPVRPAELAIATRRRHIFLSTGANNIWKQVARDGQAL